MLRADAMMDTAQPGFEVGKYEMNDGYELFGSERGNDNSSRSSMSIAMVAPA